MIVRNAVKEDSSKLLALISLKAEFDRSMKGFNGEISTSVEKIERTLFGKQRYAHALLLESSDGEVIGFALFHYRYSSFSGEPLIWLDDLLVVDERRSRGYGHVLMKSLYDLARESLASHIAWTASPYNKKAHNFYNRIGACIERMDGERPFFRWDVI
ncbi:Acetyltransferase (GNAT) family protein [Grimontia celer]|uniref:Acetyltransferase (GNAT) family protein n=1 Tax=Grimontia celer TaxID=1796497 RepID=A0A128F3X4_9GAMM|nr:GNAT family N-acetyltransferase [Grimontia celer]CZF81487.1 Acetyltransferase (GNAT) family protein [Grimontia celer]